MFLRIMLIKQSYRIG